MTGEVQRKVILGQRLQSIPLHDQNEFSDLDFFERFIQNLCGICVSWQMNESLKLLQFELDSGHQRFLTTNFFRGWTHKDCSDDVS